MKVVRWAEQPNYLKKRRWKERFRLRRSVQSAFLLTYPETHTHTLIILPFHIDLPLLLLHSRRRHTHTPLIVCYQPKKPSYFQSCLRKFSSARAFCLKLHLHLFILMKKSRNQRKMSVYWICARGNQEKVETKCVFSSNLIDLTWFVKGISAS